MSGARQTAPCATNYQNLLYTPWTHRETHLRHLHCCIWQRNLQPVRNFIASGHHHVIFRMTGSKVSCWLKCEELGSDAQWQRLKLLASPLMLLLVVVCRVLSWWWRVPSRHPIAGLLPVLIPSARMASNASYISFFATHCAYNMYVASCICVYIKPKYIYKYMTQHTYHKHN